MPTVRGVDGLLVWWQSYQNEIRLYQFDTESIILRLVIPAAVVGRNRRKRSSFLGHQLGGLTARLHGKSETASKVEVQGCFSEVDA
ncbi:hypothetical protein [Brevibacillus porteri]|uniref:hypothetical protein n=1 Tax=Brevibacillus porteri TaxID=2126350 RepID=UPI001304E3E7|nr:hypothetical protein [Brevibacillus porteri]MED1797885.1 hypothetical protein [Brevibacillus porteri]MED2130971.1 hypothetical protein [Brevibacillus porteri]MED2746970.1 hypothetical protein [Brevibacillus porteri]MED2812930.1 hypothetical protein [Brevibacillus porteri]MED2892090.1 hypothetical protein [Brevibacillus porteri]